MLYNKLGRDELQKRLDHEPFGRVTFSFYRYVRLDDPLAFRNMMFEQLSDLGCLGRIYVAKEGINAQMNVPEHNHDAFMGWMSKVPQLAGMPIKYAVEDDGKSFLKLTIKVKEKIVADGLDDGTFDTSNVGKHLSALEFHSLVGQEGVVVVDMRNNYESEVGRFEGAITPDAITFREELQQVTDLLDDKKDNKILLYCTGGVRCEKASAYLKHKGFNDVNQLYGGIIEYARQVKAANIESKFIGKNFVFDARMGERITSHIIASCHQCGAPCDTHVNCANDQCHLLFIQCPECAKKFRGCCSNECSDELVNPTQGKGAPFKGKKWRRYTGEITLLYSR